MKIPREMLGTFLPAGKYRLFCLNNTHGSSQGCVQVMKAMILFKFGIRHLERPTLKAEFNSKKERNESADTDTKRDTFLGEEAISCLSKYYANDDDDHARFINDVANRIVKGEGSMCTIKEAGQFRGNRKAGNVYRNIDKLEVFNCDDDNDDSSICNKLKTKCAEKIKEINDKKRDDYWQEYEDKEKQKKRKTEEL